MRSQCKRSVCIGLFLTIAASVCAAQQSPRSEVDSFARQLVNSSSQQRTELLAAHPQLITVALRKELLRQGNNFLVDSKYAPALDVYRLAEKVADQIKDKEGLAEIWLNIGSVYYFQGQHDLAVESYRKAQQLFTSLGNRVEAGRSLLGIALTLQAQGSLPEALTIFEQAFKEFETVSDRNEMANVLASIGSIQYDMGNYEAASKTLVRLSSLRMDAGNLLRLAAAFYMQKDYTQALTYYEQALDHATRLVNTAEVISALTGAANCYYNQRDYDRALEFYNRSLETSERLNDKSGVATQLQNLGNVHRARGDYGSALQSYFKSLEAAAAARTTGTVANSLGSIGVVRSLQGDNVQAIEYFDKSLRAFEASGDRVGIARLLSYIGNVQYLLGQYDLALAAYQRGVELHRSFADSLNQAHLTIGIGAVYVSQKKYALAVESYQQALVIYEALGRRAETAEALTKLAAAYRLQGEHAKGLEFANKALGLVHATDLRAIRSLALTEIGRLQRGLDHQSEALNAFNEAIRIRQSMRADAGLQDSATQGGDVFPYLGAMEVLVEQGNALEAFARSEDAKSELLRQIINRGNFSVTKDMTAAEQKEEIKLLGDLRSLSLQLNSVQESRPHDTNRIKALADRLTAARTAYESFRKSLYARYPNLRVYRGTLAPLNLEQMRPLLRRDTAILEYAISEEGVYLFVVTTNERKVSVNAYRQPLKPAEITLVAKDALSQQAARDLYDVLIKPAEQQIATKSKLIIIPDGVLWDVPFAALQPSPDQYVIDQKTLSFAISVSALTAMRKRRSIRPPAATVVAFADPVMTDEVVERLKTTYRDLPLQQTTNTSTEIEQLRSIYGKTRSQFYTGVNARKQQALAASNHRLLHFATRAFLDQSVPLYSFIMLSPDASDDGLLRLWEITNLNSRARVVVLPSSNLAQPRSQSGNALIAVSWAWFIAGTPNVVLSRWEADASSVTAFSSEFHRNLRRSSDTAETVRQSMLKLRQSKDRTPYDWSGFMILGY
ncbi:MAG TPA: tetratricopeptide repeat protein [Pyrinomonadaceae bacterium]|nr:tetratricopeptide repeat protein [Pyrinomonadaceae bacterium]